MAGGGGGGESQSPRSYWHSAVIHVKSQYPSPIHESGHPSAQAAASLHTQSAGEHMFQHRTLLDLRTAIEGFHNSCAAAR